MTKAQKEIQEDKQKEKRAHWSRLCWGNFGQLEREHLKIRSKRFSVQKNLVQTQKIIGSSVAEYTSGYPSVIALTEVTRFKYI